MRAFALACGMALAIAPARSSADEPSGHVTLEGGAGLGAVSHGRTFAALALVERGHIGYRLPMGLQAGFSLQHAGALWGDLDSAAELFFLGPEARYHPFGERCVDPWLGLAFGFGSLDERSPHPWRREKWSGGVLLLQAGALFRVSREIAVGAWIGTTFGLWEQSCMLSDPYQVDRCIGHRDAGMTAVGVSIAPRTAAD